MEYTEFEQLFNSALHRNELKAFEPQKIKQFHLFTEYLLEINRTTNLTAIRNIPDFIDKHLIDSLFALECIPQNAQILDLGCGPGFPSIPLAIARPDLQITALDSTAKKITFVKSSAELLQLQNLSPISGRAEDRELLKNLGPFDIVVSRAVARLNVLCELCIPYVKINGSLIAMKASKAEEELSEAKDGIRILGGKQTEIILKELYSHNGTTESRALIKILKAKPTPAPYPRSYAAILKKPL